MVSGFHDDAALARCALRDIDDPQRLARNSLLSATIGRRSHETLRACVLRALDLLETRNPEHHTIVVRCDVHGEPNKSVAARLAVSRSQFYRERHKALTSLASIVRECAERSVEVRVEHLPRPLETHELFIDMLGNCGQYEAAHREALKLAGQVDDLNRKVTFTIVASAAARFIGLYGEAEQLINHARAMVAASGEPPGAAAAWIDMGEIALRIVQADFARARNILASAARGSDDATLHGRQARLVSIMLTYVAVMESQCGNWQQTRTLLRRADSVARRTGDEDRTDALLRISGRLALHVDGDLERARADHRQALAIAQQRSQLKDMGRAAVEFGVACIDADAAQAAHYVQMGLSVAERFPDHDNFAMLVCEAMPALLRAGENDAAQDWIERVRSRGRLSVRSAPAVDLAQARWLLATSKARDAVEYANGAAQRLLAYGMLPWACDAELVQVEGQILLEQRAGARKSLRDLTELAQAGGRIDTHKHLRRFGTILGL